MSFLRVSLSLRVSCLSSYSWRLGGVTRLLGSPPLHPLLYVLSSAPHTYLSVFRVSPGPSALQVLLWRLINSDWVSLRNAGGPRVFPPVCLLSVSLFALELFHICDRNSAALCVGSLSFVPLSLLTASRHGTGAQLFCCLEERLGAQNLKKGSCCCLEPCVDLKVTTGPGFVQQSLNKAAVPEEEEATLLQLIKNRFIWTRARGW